MKKRFKMIDIFKFTFSKKKERITRIIDIFIGTITTYVIIYIGFKLIY